MLLHINFGKHLVDWDKKLDFSKLPVKQMMLFWFYIGKHTVNQRMVHEHETKLWHQLLVSTMQE